MLDTNLIPARNLQKSYKSIIEEVKNNKSTVVLTTRNKPQAAIVSLEDLEKININKIRQADMDLLKLAKDNLVELKHLPTDLRNRANEILYTK